MEFSPSHVHYVSTSSQEDEAADQFSALPDDILVDIVGRLDLRTTVRAGAVSRRWRHIPRSLPDLTINVYDLLPARPSPHSINMALTAYAAATSWLLAPSTRRTIRTLVLCFYLVDPYLQIIGRAVEDVAERGGLELLQFTIPARPGADLLQDGESFGQLFMSLFDTYPAAFKCLTSLDLEKIRLGESAMSALLNTCSKLRYLSLTECDSGPALPVKLDAPNSDICTLKLEWCGYRTVELLNLPKLAALYCHEWCGDNLPIRFGYVPCLEIVLVSFPCLFWQEPFKLSDWLPNCRNLYNLSLDFKDEKIWIKPEGPRQLSHMFGNLRVVSLYNVFHDCDLNWTLFVLEAAPSITNFLVNISWHVCNRNKCEDSAEKINVPWDASNFQHPRLSLLEIQGFFVEKMVMRYIRLIIRPAMRLEKIRLLKQDPSEKCGSSLCKLQSLTRLRFPVQKREKNTIKERLTEGLSSSVEIIIE